MGREESRDREQEIFDLIPADGARIRFKNLLEKCKQPRLKIGHTVLAKYLDRLENKRMIAREPVADKEGAGISYKRLTGIEKLTIPGTTQTLLFHEWIGEAVESVKSARKEERKKVAAIKLYSILVTIGWTVHHELLEHAGSNDIEQADRHLDSVFRVFILPMIKRITPLSDLPAASSAHAEAAVREAFLKGMRGWDKTWEKTRKTSDSHREDDRIKKRR